MDILLGNNFFASQPETSYLDGGLSWLIKGVGDHKFSCVWPNRSGISNLGDTNGLAVADLDLDGGLDAVFLQNNGPARSYENLTATSSANSSATMLRLEGPAGNSHCVGCRAELISDNSTRAVEYHAGGSYLSQSFRPSIALTPEETRALKSVLVTWSDGTSLTTEITDTPKNLVIKYADQQ